MNSRAIITPFSGRGYKLGSSIGIPERRKPLVLDSFHFDALHSFSSMIQSYDSKVKSFETTFKAEVLCRIFQVAQMVVILALHIFKQILRMITTLVSGILTLNHHRISFFMKDLISIPIQIFLLPILSFVALFSPQYAKELSDDVANGLNKNKNGFVEGSATIYSQVLKVEDDTCSQKVALHIFERLLLPVQVFLTVISRIVADILSFNFEMQTIRNVGVAITAPLFIFLPHIETAAQKYGGIVPGAN